MCAGKQAHDHHSGRVLKSGPQQGWPKSLRARQSRIDPPGLGTTPAAAAAAAKPASFAARSLFLFLSLRFTNASRYIHGTLCQCGAVLHHRPLNNLGITTSVNPVVIIFWRNPSKVLGCCLRVCRLPLLSAPSCLLSSQPIIIPRQTRLPSSSVPQTHPDPPKKTSTRPNPTQVQYIQSSPPAPAPAPALVRHWSWPWTRPHRYLAFSLRIPSPRDFHGRLRPKLFECHIDSADMQPSCRL